MATIVVGLDMVEVHRVSNSWHIVDAFGVVPEVWIIDQAFEIAFEMTMVNGIEAHECSEEANISFSETVAN